LKTSFGYYLVKCVIVIICAKNCKNQFKVFEVTVRKLLIFCDMVL